jgi:hypothetical protein
MVIITDGNRRYVATGAWIEKVIRSVGAARDCGRQARDFRVFRAADGSLRVEEIDRSFPLFRAPECR